MMTFRAGALVLAASVVLWSSCAPKRSGTLHDREEPDAAHLMARIAAGTGLVQSMTGTGSVSFETPELGGSVYFRVSVRRPDSLLVRFEGPFGMDVGFLFLTAQRFVMYNGIENEVTTGVPTAGSIRSFIPFDLTYDQIVNAFAGAFPMPPDSSVARTSMGEGDTYMLTYPCGDDSCIYWIDGSTYRVTRYMIRDRIGNIAMDAEANRFYEEDDLAVPRLITISFPAQQRQVSIYYSSLVLNPSSVPFSFSVPAGARKKVRS